MKLLRRIFRLLRLLAHIGVGAWLAGTRLPAAPPPQSEPEWKVVRNWNLRLLRILGIRTEIRGTPASGSVLFVANHVSWLDIATLLTVLDAGFLGKAELERWPVLGFIIRRGGTIFIHRGRHGAAGEAVAAMTRRLERGQRVAAFPEGTTTDGNNVRPFHRPLFQAAVCAGAHIQPVALVYETPDASWVEQPLFAHLWRLLGIRHSRVTVTLLPPIPPTRSDARALARETHAAIADIVRAPSDPLESTDPRPRAQNTGTTAPH